MILSACPGFNGMACNISSWRSQCGHPSWRWAPGQKCSSSVIFFVTVQVRWDAYPCTLTSRGPHSTLINLLLSYRLQSGKYEQAVVGLIIAAAAKMISVDLRGHDFRPQVITFLLSFVCEASLCGFCQSHSWFRFMGRIIEDPACTMQLRQTVCTPFEVAICSEIRMALNAIWICFRPLCESHSPSFPASL